MKAQDVARVTELCSRRSKMLAHLAEIDAPPVIVPMKMQEPRPVPEKPKVWQVGRAHWNGQHGLVTDVLCEVPVEFVRMLIVQELAKVERELLQLGVQL